MVKKQNMLQWNLTLVQQISFLNPAWEGLRHTYPVTEAPVEHNLVTKTDLCASTCSVFVCLSQDTELVQHTMVRELLHYLTQVFAPSVYCYSASIIGATKKAARKWLNISNDENASGTPI